NIERLENRLEVIKETSDNPNVDKLLDKLTNNSLKHQQLFDNLKLKFENRPALIEKLENIQNRANDVIAKIPEKFEDALKFKERIQKIIEKQPQRIFKELRAVEFLDRIEEKLPEDKKEHLQNLKENLISAFENKIQNWTDVDKKKFLKTEIIQRLPGDNLRRINILEQVGEKISDSNIRVRIQGVKEGLVKYIDPEASQERVLKLIKQAKTLIAKVENLLSDKPNDKIAELLERAKTYLANANKALNENKIGEAFGQANSAISVARNALQQIQQGSGGTTACPLIAPACLVGETAVRTNEKDAKGCPILRCTHISDSGTTSTTTSQSYIRPIPFCIQVITPAISPNGVCKNFPTPCDVPATWKKVNKCPTATIPSTGTQDTTGTTNQ
ncbi:MAG: hypothetical protein V3T98_02110, partial [Candidatus Paceibacterota bacterium]